MEFIGSIAGLFSVIFLVLTIVAWFKPAAFTDKKTGKVPKRSEIAGGMFVLMLIASGISVWLSPQPSAPADKPKPVSSATSSTTPVAATATALIETEAPPKRADEKTLGITLDQYVKNFNAIGAKLKPTQEAYLGEVQEGPVNDVARIKIDDNRMLMVTLKRGTKTVTEVTLIGQGDGTAASGLYLMITCLTAMQAAVPESERDGMGEMMGRLLERMERDKDAVSEVIGNNKFWVNSSSITGFMAGVTPVEET